MQLFVFSVSFEIMVQYVDEPNDACDQVDKDQHKKEILHHRRNICGIPFLKKNQASVNDHNNEIRGSHNHIETVEEKFSVRSFKQIPWYQEVHCKIGHCHGEWNQQTGKPDHIGLVVRIVTEKIEIQKPYPYPE